MKYILAIFSCIIFESTISQEKQPELKDPNSVSMQTENDFMDFAIVEVVPIYKGCENAKGNAKKKDCMSKKIGAIFAENFERTIHQDSELETGITRVFVSFKVDKEGQIIDLAARAKDKYLEEEAIRVGKLIPHLEKPGYQLGKPVIVPYTLPLLVNLEREKDTSFEFPIYRGCDKKLNFSEQKKCTQKKITDFIRVSYNLDVADRALPLEKSTKFQLDFIINKKGKVENVNAKANHKAIAIEAIRTAKRLPRFKKPGFKNGKAIETPMSITMTIYF